MYKGSLSGLLPRWALVSEYLCGGDVFDAVAKQLFKETRARQVMADLLSALAHIHRRGIVHRDVKAENLLLAKDGRAVLTDFGIAALVSDEEAMGKFSGSPGYVAEILSKKPYGIKVDSFSVGVLLYFMLCGGLPFQGKTVKSTLKRTMTREVSFDNHPEFLNVTHQCKSFILKLLEKPSENRPSAEQASSQLWCINGGHYCGPQEGINQYTPSTNSERMSLKIHDALNMPEKGFDDVFMASDQRPSVIGFPLLEVITIKSRKAWWCPGGPGQKRRQRLRGRIFRRKILIPRFLEPQDQAFDVESDNQQDR